MAGIKHTSRKTTTRTMTKQWLRLEDAVHHLVFALDCFNHGPWTSAKHLTTSPLMVQEVLHNWQRVERQEEVLTTWWWETWTKKDGKACPNIPKPIQVNAGKYAQHMG